MSPLWRDQLRIYLYPDKVEIVRLRKGWRPTIASEHSIACEPVAELAPWFASLNALMQWLGEAKPQKADVVVVLSNHFVRYCLLPWTPEIGNAQEELAFARIHFEKVFGDLASQWSLRISDAPYECPRLASAVDLDLLSGVTEVFANGALRLISIQPYLMHFLNDCRSRMREQQGLFLLVEPGKACLLRFNPKSVLDLKSIVLQEEFLDELAGLLQREMLFCGLDERTTIYVHAAAYPTLPLADKVTAHFHMLAVPEKTIEAPGNKALLGDAMTRVA